MQSACSQLQTCPGLTQLLTAVLELGNHLNAGTHRGAAAGFRLDTLLKLADVKGVDRKTSLLHFVVRQLAAQGDIVVQLPAQLSAVRPAAAMQVRGHRCRKGEEGWRGHAAVMGGGASRKGGPAGTLGEEASGREKLQEPCWAPEHTDSNTRTTDNAVAATYLGDS